MNDFDLLRVRIESEVGRPGIVAVTASTAQDGGLIAARGLATSLATIGYNTLFVNTSLAADAPSSFPAGLSFEEIGRLQGATDPEPGEAAVLALGDVTLQRKTSHRGAEAALDVLRSRNDYVVISTGPGAAPAFANTIVATADAVLVAVRIGRRELPEDLRLSAALDYLGPRFLGLVALDPSLIDDDPAIPAPAALSAGRRPTLVDKERQRRGVAESPT